MLSDFMAVCCSSLSGCTSVMVESSRPPDSSCSFCYVSVGVHSTLLSVLIAQLFRAEKFVRESLLSALKFQQLQLEVWQTFRGE